MELKKTKVTLEDVASEAGVAKSTVTRVINCIIVHMALTRLWTGMSLCTMRPGGMNRKVISISVPDGRLP
ncbi:MAG: hypothetical protein K0R28_5179 [Paenibacillus sp.]|jgi:hypothetical protein|nr:hypothetical protein [Paenibacillus sp.]